MGANHENKKCRWFEEGDGYEGLGLWNTSCGETFCITEGTPEDNGMDFCCYCGRLIEQIPFVHDEDEEVTE